MLFDKITTDELLKSIYFYFSVFLRNCVSVVLRIIFQNNTYVWEILIIALSIAEFGRCFSGSLLHFILHNSISVGST